ncbi:nucleotidyltransferase domain-containing protein [Thermofilum pendens]|uniref:Polymerase beta nucleotidyltransferase domain-containing protein n=1 Tax=Thermofilum pendens (strain DSM 2475 / Hrk 5) TaxID=368408 RepID=A1RZF0_THEPD|nr:nucleotidyltransferase domain-containing protein [Thermofilum pendens]ABL78580.1 hypothetical protein Tpen_1182 [Thermofilum pendens Hrk 5]
MSKLRILEEKLRRPRFIPWDARREIIARIAQLLMDRPEVLIAVVHGGFISSDIFRDIDIAVYLGHKLPFMDTVFYVDRLRDRLQEALKIDIALDVQLLDYAPPAFTYRILSSGQIIVERMPGLASILKIRALEDLEKLRKFRG